MDATELTRLLHALSPGDWEALAASGSLLLVDDMSLTVGPPDAPRPLYRQAGDAPTDPEHLKSQLLAEAADLVTAYYRAVPLSRSGFDRQVAALLERHGASAFAAIDGERPEFSLFVDGGEVVAEGRDSPRHPYGACCELDSGQLTEREVRAWLARGEAYERYLSMNVCRYNC